MVIVAIILFVFVLSLIVLVHELGHFIFAKRNGVKVEEFGIGYPPRAIGWYKSKKTGKWKKFKGNGEAKDPDMQGTMYSINWIPFGGFVKMLGEEEDVKKNNSFSEKTPWQRAKIIFAGVLFNFILAWILLTIWFWVVPQDIDSKVVVTSVNENSIAQEIGIKTNDFLTEINGVKIQNIDSLKEQLAENAGQKVNLVYERFGKDNQIEINVPDQDLPLGVGIVETGGNEIEGYVWWKAPYYSLVEIGSVIYVSFIFIIDLIGSIFKDTGADASMVSGPIGVFAFLYQVMYLGWAYLLRFVALISVAVGFFNLLPLPALDGGHLLLLAGEAIKGKRILKKDFENKMHTIGFFVLIALLVLVTYNDIVKWFIK